MVYELIVSHTRFLPRGTAAFPLEGHTALVGPNGSGKTSLINLVLLFQGLRYADLFRSASPLRDLEQVYFPTEHSFVLYNYRSRLGPRSVLFLLQEGSPVFYFLPQPLTLEEARGILLAGEGSIMDRLRAWSAAQGLAHYVLWGERSRGLSHERFRKVLEGEEASDPRRLYALEKKGYRVLRHLLLPFARPGQRLEREGLKTAFLEAYRLKTEGRLNAILDNPSHLLPWERLKSFQELLVLVEDLEALQPMYQDYQKLKAEEARLQKALGEVRETLAQGLTVLEAYLQELEGEMTRTREGLEATRAELEGRIGAVQERMGSLEALLSEARITVRGLQRKRESLLAQLGDPGEAEARLRELPSIESRLQALEERLAGLGASSLEALLEGARRRLEEEKRNRRAALEAEHRKALEDLEARAREERAQLRARSEAQREAVARERQALLEKAHGLQGALEAKTQEAQALEEAIQGLGEELAGLRETKGGLQEALRHLEARKGEVGQRLEALRKEARQREEEVERFRNPPPGSLLARLREERPESLPAALRALEGEALLRPDLAPKEEGEGVGFYGFVLDWHRLPSKDEEGRRRLSDLLADLKALEAELQALEGEAQEHQARLEALSGREEELAQALILRRQAKAGLAREVQDLRDGLTVLQREIQAREREETRLLQEKDRALEALEARIEGLREEARRRFLKAQEALEEEAQRALKAYLEALEAPGQVGALLEEKARLEEARDRLRGLREDYERYQAFLREEEPQLEAAKVQEASYAQALEGLREERKALEEGLRAAEAEAGRRLFALEQAREEARGLLEALRGLGLSPRPASGPPDLKALRQALRLYQELKAGLERTRKDRETKETYLMGQVDRLRAHEAFRLFYSFGLLEGDLFGSPLDAVFGEVPSLRARLNERWRQLLWDLEEGLARAEELKEELLALGEAVARKLREIQERGQVPEEDRVGLKVQALLPAWAGPLRDFLKGLPRDRAPSSSGLRSALETTRLEDHRRQRPDLLEIGLFLRGRPIGRVGERLSTGQGIMASLFVLLALFHVAGVEEAIFPLDEAGILDPGNLGLALDLLEGEGLRLLTASPQYPPGFSRGEGRRIAMVYLRGRWHPVEPRVAHDR